MISCGFTAINNEISFMKTKNETLLSCVKGLKATKDNQNHYILHTDLS